jgi:hypothetical protein
VPAPAIADACRESQEWMQRMSRIDAGQFDDASAADMGNEPYLLGFVVAEVEDAVEDGLDLGDPEKATVFFVLKTVIASMTGIIR